VLATQVHAHEESAGAFHNRGNGRKVERPADEVPFLTLLLWVISDCRRVSITPRATGMA
jgi:hypothetical protein